MIEVPGPSYLTGERIYLRAPLKDDTAASASWFPSVFPVGSGKAESHLKDQLKRVWWPGDRLHMMVVRADDDQIVGGVIVEHPTGPTTTVALRFSPILAFADADRMQADTLKILVPWLINEAEVLTITVDVGADQDLTLAAAGELGMSQQVRLREFLARPGGRVDMIQLQALNPRRAACVTDDGCADQEVQP